MNVIVLNKSGQVYQALDAKMSTGEINDRLGTTDWRMVDVRELPPGPPWTVGQLKAALEAWPPEMHVVVDDGHGWYHYIGKLAGPVRRPVAGGEGQGEWSDEESGYSLPTLLRGRTFDSRDL